MKYLKLYSQITFIVFLYISISSCAQNKKHTDTPNKDIRAVAKEIMANANTCALITVDSLNRPRVRMMGTLKPDKDFTVWFGTNPNSRKVMQINQNPEVTVYYTEEGNSGYIILQGTAQLVNDIKEKETHFKDEWKEFYPNYPDDYMLIKVIPNWLEVVSYKHNILGDTETWEPQTIVFD